LRSASKIGGENVKGGGRGSIGPFLKRPAVLRRSRESRYAGKKKRGEGEREPGGRLLKKVPAVHRARHGGKRERITFGEGQELNQSKDARKPS